jgi:hypothetical protein
MINFRFHVVSLIAVFLALAIGVVMGSAVIDQALVDGLQNRINAVEKRADDQEARNDELQGDLDRLQGYADASGEFAVTDRLTGVPVAVVAVRGVDGDTVRDAVGLAERAGGRAPGVLWLEEKWLLEDDESRQQLADILGEPSTANGLRGTAWAALAERLAAGGAPSADDLLAALADAGFVDLETTGEGTELFGFGTYPGLDARVLLVDGTDAPETMSALVGSAARALVAAELPLVVAEVHRDEEDGPDRGERVAVVRGDDELSAVVSTVDDLDRPGGRVAAILALSDLARNIVGHYGDGDGASAILPEWSPT